jgi:hypothetical protein
MRGSSGKAVYDKAAELAHTGRYADARDLIWHLFKLGYARAGDQIGFFQRRRLDRFCRQARQQRSASGLTSCTD